MSIEGQRDYFSELYYGNLGCIWDSLLPAPDIRIIKADGTIEPVDQTTQAIALHYLYNVAQLTVSLAALPFSFTLSALSSLNKKQITVESSPHKEKHFPPPAFGFANSGFQDGAIGTSYDPSTLNGQGVGDWDKILKRPIQRVTENGEKIVTITDGITLEEAKHGITLKKGERIEDLFVNTIDHPKAFAKLLSELGCNAYRISLERSVIEPESGKFNPVAIGKYTALFQALNDEGIEVWGTIDHFTEPDWLEKKGGFANEKNIDGFVKYCEKMVDVFSFGDKPLIRNWMTFNEPGIRALEGYVRGEHPPEKSDISTAAQVIRNLLIAHTKAFDAMKAKRADLNIGITHQWLEFKSFGSNPIEKITAFFFTSLIHTPIFNFFKNGEMKIKIPFKANVQLIDQRSPTTKMANFLGVQIYGFTDLMIAPHWGIHHPGAADKVHNFTIPFLGLTFTAGSTCGKGGSMQYFGPPDRPDDLNRALKQAFSIPKERIPDIGITETGSDAKRMKFGETEIKVDDEAQARSYGEIYAITQNYPLVCLFFWTLNRHCEWRSGGMPHLGVTKLRNELDGSISYKETLGLLKVQEIFQAMQKALVPEKSLRAS